MAEEGRLTERLEVRLTERMAGRLRREAEGRGVPVARLVRQAIEALLEGDRKARIQAAEELFEVGAPVADWPVMEAEIRAAREEERS